MLFVCPEIKEGRIARAREKGSDGVTEQYKDTECDKGERQGEEIGEDRLKKDVVEQEEEGWLGRGEVREGIGMNEVYHITCNSNNGLLI